MKDCNPCHAQKLDMQRRHYSLYLQLSEQCVPIEGWLLLTSLLDELAIGDFYKSPGHACCCRSHLKCTHRNCDALFMHVAELQRHLAQFHAGMATENEKSVGMTHQGSEEDHW